jgi:DNA (cytosine-5)-methyltransferase 1
MYSESKHLNNNDAVARKIARLASGAQARVIDLFSGCGGISLGFQRAGFDILAAMEIDNLAARSHAENFYRGADRELIDLHARPRDITRIEPDELTEEFGLGLAEDAIDVLVGGPPCQAYARVGRAKLREIAEHPQAYKVDSRGNLYLRYLAYVQALKPVALMMENVPDILHYGGHNVIEEMVETLDGMGYDAKYSLLNAAFYGVPQMRDRVFLIAFRKELCAHIRFPHASRHMKLPSGYEGTRAVALKFVDLLGGNGYVAPDLGSTDLPFAVTASEALGDLPPITLHLEGKLRRGARRFTELIRYQQTNELSAYAAEMRQWPGFESLEGIRDHVIRYLPRDTYIFREMQPGTEYPAAHRVATRLFEQNAKKLGIHKGTKAYDELYRKMVPPYRIDTFPNRWWKLRADFPVRTLMAHIGKDTYSHIHYDDAQGRTISVREAARLQSFPDGFVLSGTMNPAFKQIGNAVPPLMARALADTIQKTLSESLANISQADTAAAAE